MSLANPATTSRSRQSVCARTMASMSFGSSPSLSLRTANRIRSSDEALEPSQNGRLSPQSSTRRRSASARSSSAKSARSRDVVRGLRGTWDMQSSVALTCGPAWRGPGPPQFYYCAAEASLLGAARKPRTPIARAVTGRSRQVSMQQPFFSSVSCPSNGSSPQRPASATPSNRLNQYTLGNGNRRSKEPSLAGPRQAS